MSAGGESRIAEGAGASARSGRRQSLAVEAIALALLPASMVFAVVAAPGQTAAVCLVASIASLALFFAAYELDRPSVRETMPVVVMGALAAAGRILFAPFPDVKPVSAICIVAGAVFGRRAGFMVGALAALVSNFFFGQGAWTPWQMYAWGMVGWLAGVLARTGAFERPWAVYSYGAASGLLYGLILNLWSLLGFYHPQTLADALVIWAAALPLDLVHSAATVAFLAILWAPWHRKFERLKAVYGL